MASDRTEQRPWLLGKLNVGYITANGIHVIRRSIGGKRFERSTQRTRESAAVAEYLKFENDPVNYRPTGEKVRGPAPIFLTTELIDEHIAWAVRAKKVTSQKWEARNLGKCRNLASAFWTTAAASA